MSEDTRPDDLSILNEHRLLRRVGPNQVVPVDDGTMRPTSDVFGQPEMSVFIEPLLIELGLPPEEALRDHPGFFLCSITAGEVRKFEHPIVKDNEPPKHPAHGLVLGKKKGSFKSAMARGQKWVVAPPPGYTPPENNR